MTTARRIAIVGSGNMGGALGTAWARAGHAVVFTYARAPDRPPAPASPPRPCVTATS